MSKPSGITLPFIVFPARRCSSPQPFWSTSLASLSLRSKWRLPSSRGCTWANSLPIMKLFPTTLWFSTSASAPGTLTKLGALSTLGRANTRVFKSSQISFFGFCDNCECGKHFKVSGRVPSRAGRLSRKLGVLSVIAESNLEKSICSAWRVPVTQVSPEMEDAAIQWSKGTAGVLGKLRKVFAGRNLVDRFGSKRFVRYLNLESKGGLFGRWSEEDNCKKQCILKITIFHG